MNAAGSTFEVLTPPECLDLLAGEWRGRIGVSNRALPAILPVSYLVADGQIVFRSMAGSKLEAIGRGEVVCFEADHADRATGTAWSVLVVGQARSVIDPAECAALDSLGADLWPPIDAAAWVQLDTEVISGRRLAPASPGGAHPPD